MNTLKVHDLLTQRYSTHFLDLVQNITRPVFGTPCSYSNTVMKSPLREKIQNAINRAITDSSHHYNDYNNNSGEGALIVGGRRRNRKKKNKKNGQKKKKSSSPDIKSRLSPSRCRKGGKDQDNTPLIECGGELGEDNSLDNKENENMVFDFVKKKKKDAAKEAEKKEVPPQNETAADKESADQGDGSPTQAQSNEGSTPDPQQAGAEVKEEAKQEVVEVCEEARVAPTEAEIQNKTEAEPTDSGAVEVSQANGKPVVTFAKEASQDQTAGEGEAQTQPQDGGAITKKSEKSPLIGKTEGATPKDGGSTNVKDSQPGFLCCTIL